MYIVEYLGVAHVLHISTIVYRTVTKDVPPKKLANYMFLIYFMLKGIQRRVAYHNNYTLWSDK